MSSVLKVTVPITLSRDNDGYCLHAQVQNGNAATIFLGALAEGLVKEVFNAWALEQLVAAYTSKRRKTGLMDAAGHALAEGDIIQRHYNEQYGVVTGVIKWDGEKAAFVAEGAFEDGGGWKTLNLEDAAKWNLIGNIFITPELLQPAKPIA